MKANSRYLFCVLALAFGISIAAPAADSELALKMREMGAAFKAINTDVRAIKATPAVPHDAEWTNIAKQGRLMAGIAVLCKTIFPSTVAGNATLEREYSDTLEDLRKSIVENLVKAAEMKELALTEKAAREVNDKRAAAHKKYMP